MLFLSPNAVSKAGYVQKEIREALDVAERMPEGRTFIIPVRLQPCEVPQRLQRWQWVDFQTRNGYARLKTALGGHARPRARKASRLPRANAFPNPVDEIVYNAILEADKLYFGKSHDGRTLLSQNHFSVIRSEFPAIFADLKSRVASNEVTADEIREVIPSSAVWMHDHTRVRRIDIPPGEDFVILESAVARRAIRTRYWRLSIVVAPSGRAYVTPDNRNSFFEEDGEVVMSVGPAILDEAEEKRFNITPRK